MKRVTAELARRCSSLAGAGEREDDQADDRARARRVRGRVRLERRDRAAAGRGLHGARAAEPAARRERATRRTSSPFSRTVKGPIVLVGHSYGGFVITNAATGNANVKALVYVAAFAPAQGDTVQRCRRDGAGRKLGPDTLDILPLPAPGRHDGPGGARSSRRRSARSSRPTCRASWRRCMAASQRPASLVDARRAVRRAGLGEHPVLLR